MAQTEDFFSLYKKDNEDFFSEETPIEPPRRARGFFYVVAFLAFAGIFALIGLFLFKPSDAIRDPLLITVDGPDTVRLHETVTYRISYKNNEKRALTDALLEIHYPGGFVATSVEPAAENEKKNFWRLAPIAPFRTNTIDIIGSFEDSQTENDQAFRITMTYKEDSLATRFTSKSEKTVRTTISNFTLSLSGPSQAVKDASVEYHVQGDDVSHMGARSSLACAVPKDFSLDEVAPKNESSRDTIILWSQDGLSKQFAAKQPFDIRLKGHFSDVSQSPLLFSCRVIDSKDAELTESHVETVVVASGALIKLAVNGNEDPKNFNFGDTLVYSVTYENATDAPLLDASLSVSVASEVIDWNSFRDDHLGIVKDGVITWTQKQISDLKKIDPHTTHEIKILLGIKNTHDVRTIIQDPTKTHVTSSAQLQAGEVTASSPSLVVPLNSDADVDTTQSQTTDSQGSVITRVKHVITNTMHALEKLSLDASLPNDARVSDISVSAGEAVFSEKNTTMHWALNRLPSNVSTVTIEYSVLTKAPLGGAIVLQGTDTQSLGVISHTHQFLTQ